MSNNLKGILWINLLSLSNALLFLSVKQLSSSLNPAQIVFFSNLCALIIIVPFIIKKGLKPLPSAKIFKLFILRGIIEALAFSALFFSLSKITLSQSTSLQFLGPLLSVTIVMIILGEKPKAYTWLTLFLGFAGVLLIAPPTSDSFGIGHLVCIVSALLFAFVPTIISILVKEHSPITTSFYFLLIISILSAIPALISWPNLYDYKIIITCFIAGLFSLISQFAVGKALDKAPVSIVMPFLFTNLIFSTIFGAIIYGEEVKIMTIAGGAIILGSAIYATIKSSRQEI